MPPNINDNIIDITREIATVSGDVRALTAEFREMKQDHNRRLETIEKANLKLMLAVAILAAGGAAASNIVLKLIGG